MSNRPGSNPGAEGFTMVELMVVVAIIAILGLLAGPEFASWLPNHRLRNAAQDLYANMQRAKMGAIKNNQNWGLLFDTAAGTYTLCENYNDDSDCADGTETATTYTLSAYGSGVAYGYGAATQQATATGGAFGCDGDTDKSCLVTYAGDEVTFQPDGTTDALGYVYLDNNIDTTFALATPSLGGVVVLKKWFGGSWQ